jgi:hypothetical protein
LKRLRLIDAGTLSAADADADEAEESKGALSEAALDAGKCASADSDVIDLGDDEGAPVASIDDGSVGAASDEDVTATETAFNDADTLLDPVAEVAGEMGWEGFLEQDESVADDDEQGEEDTERVRLFQLYDMGKEFPQYHRENARGFAAGSLSLALGGSRGPSSTSLTESVGVNVIN